MAETREARRRSLNISLYITGLLAPFKYQNQPQTVGALLLLFLLFLC